MSDCFKKNDLMIPGTRQDQRLTKGLATGYVLPDERKIADLMVFITKYSELLKYYSATEPNQIDYKVDGNWKPLILSDDAFNYAGLSVINYNLPNVTFYKYINNYETGSTQQNRFAAYRVWWDIICSLYRDINIFYQELPVHIPLHSFIGEEITNNLVTDLSHLAGAYLNASSITILPTLILQVSTSSANDDYKFDFAKTILGKGLDPIWIDKSIAPAATNWGLYLGVLNPNLPLAQDFFHTADITNEFDRIDYSTIRLKQVFRKAFESYSRIINEANVLLQSSLNANSSHYAHHGLLLAFLKLFGLVQADMNNFTRKHLEYYYTRVLHLEPAPATPDAVNIIFEAAKNTITHLVPKGTLLNAGKDNLGKLLLYETTNELVINQTKIVELKTNFIKPGATAGTVEKIYASPIAQSVDGNGAPFTGNDQSWEAFGDIRKDAVTSAETNIAQLGFYLAAPILHMIEGNRVIEFAFKSDSAGYNLLQSLSDSDWKSLFTIYATGEKGWIQLQDENRNLTYDYSTYKLTITLLQQFPAVLGYDEKLHAANLATNFPTFKFLLNQSNANAYETFKNIAITEIDISLTSSNIAGLTLQNDAGQVAAGKPVQIFGPIPKINSAFYVGHPELAHKHIEEVMLEFKWQDLPSNLKDYYEYDANQTTAMYVSNITGNNSFQASTSFLRNRLWVTPQAPTVNIFDTDLYLDFAATDIKSPLVKPDSYGKQLPVFNTDTRDGFASLTLSAPADAFGHARWPAAFASQTIALTKDNDPTHNTLPNPPYTPVFKSLALQYTAKSTIKFDSAYDAAEGQFFELLPFGNKLKTKSVTLLPVFDMQVKKDDGSIDTNLFESALYIGISNSIINENISLLLQVNEGSEDISVDHSAISWNYLSVSGWKHLDKKLLADNTNNLVASGIVLFQVPVDPNLQSTELASGLLWIRAGLEKGSEGLPRMIAVYTNAVEADFLDKGNSPDHLASALPPNTISKLFEADGDVKKVSQPYASFGGKQLEAGEKYYRRISERLRHKHRAITIWDHERIVLNQFPEVYMIKCLNHTGYEIDCNTMSKKYKENIPGSVMLVTVPFVTNLQSGNIYEPSFSTSKLDEIKFYIEGFDDGTDCGKNTKALHCQLAKLLVENPAYETISVKCKVKIKPCYDALYYKAKISDDLNAFLSPWIKGDEGKLNFGGRLHVSVVIYFIEQLPYVDYLENLEFTQKDQNGTVLNTVDPAWAITETSRSILTSAGSHSIDLIT